MSKTDTYEPPKVWTWDQESGGKFANINRPIAGATHDKELPQGKHPLQLHSMGTPNGVKVTVMLEELLAAGHKGAEYDAWMIQIGEGDQFGSGFVGINPNSKIPALLDTTTDPETRVFESASILMYLADKFEAFIPQDHHGRTECMNWLFWQMGSAPYLGGGFGHFYAYAPEKFQYPIDRFSMETKRQLDVLNRHLGEHEFFAGSEYSIADMAIWPWYGALVKGLLYGESATFLSVHEYDNVIRWTDQIAKRPAVQRGRIVNRTWGAPNAQLKDRHSAGDIDEVLAKPAEEAAE
ncbi:MAG: glutathione-dependent disulfide-bond oxidoreductase [Pseudomonadota bacterium]